MTTTDTRAALDAAILKYGGDAATSYEFHARPPDDRDLNAAITAHVEAEVTRRLAAAPGVETALAAYGAAVYDLGYVLHRPDRDAVLRPIKDAAEATLRAAIAADRERAVEAAEHAAFIRCRDAVRAHPDGWGLIARPTPDEARRLVGEFAGAHGAMVAHLAGMIGPESGEDVAARTESARTALLRALGVEA